MSIISEKIDYIIRMGPHPTLKKEGFLKSSRTFRRAITNCIQITNVQGSWNNYKDQGQFTVNLAVCFPEAAKLQGLFQVTDRPVESDCIVRQQIGNLMPVRKDYWWKIDSNSNLDKIAKEVTSAWLKYGKSWLDEYSTLEGALRFSSSRMTPYWTSIFSLTLGSKENVPHYLSEAITEAAQNPGFTSRLKEWGRSKGLRV